MAAAMSCWRRPFPRRRLDAATLLDRLRPGLSLGQGHSLYSRDLVGHFGCVNAVEFSPGSGTLLASGGDDRRVLVWDWNRAIDDDATFRPGAEAAFLPHQIMKGPHNSNIFCLAFTASRAQILSGGNDEQVLVHDVATKALLDVYPHEESIYGVSVHPETPSVFCTACSDGKVHLYDTRQPSSEDPVLMASHDYPFHAVVFNPADPRLLVTANQWAGLELYDVRKPTKVALEYGNLGGRKTAMSVQFSRDGQRLLGLRRRLPPVVFDVHDPDPYAEFDHPGYYNSCTMKSGAFGGLDDEYVMSGSDDFNLYVWKIPEEKGWVAQADFVLKGHRSIVNQVRYNPQFSTIASSGVEKVIKFWNPLKLPGSRKSEDDPKSAAGNADTEPGRTIFTRQEYIQLVLQSGSLMAHDYSTESVEENPRMIAFFDSLVQREIENGSSSSSSGSDNSSSSQDEAEEENETEVATNGDNEDLGGPDRPRTISELITRKRSQLRNRRRLKRKLVDPDILHSTLSRAKRIISLSSGESQNSSSQDDSISSSSTSTPSTSPRSIPMPAELCQSPPPKSSEEMRSAILRSLQTAEICDKTDDEETETNVESEKCKASTSHSTSPESENNDGEKERKHFKKCSKGKIKRSQRNYRKRSSEEEEEEEEDKREEHDNNSKKEKES